MRITWARRRVAIAAAVVAGVALFLGVRPRPQGKVDARIVGHWRADDGRRVQMQRQQLPRTYGYSFFADGTGLLRYSSGNYSRVGWSSSGDSLVVELREFGPLSLISNLRHRWQAVTGHLRPTTRRLHVDDHHGEMKLVRAGIEDMIRIPLEVMPDDRAFLERGAE